MKNKFLIVTTIFVMSICLGIVSFFVTRWLVTSKLNSEDVRGIEGGGQIISNEETTSTQDVFQKGVTSSVEEVTSWSAKMPLLPASSVKELESQDLKISFVNNVYMPDPIPGATNNYRVYNFPPRDAGNDAWVFSTTTDWLIGVESNFTYKPDNAMKCVSSIEKVTIDGRSVNLCRDGWDSDLYGINAFIFDDISKVKMSIRAASEEAKSGAISVIERGLKWK